MRGAARCRRRGWHSTGSIEDDAVRILYLTNSFSLLSETFVYDRAVALRARGHEVQVVTIKRRMVEERPFEGVHVLRKAAWPARLVSRFRDEALPRLRMRAGDGDAVPASTPEADYLADLHALAERFRPDFIHAEFGRMGVLANRIATPSRPLVVFMHAYDITAVPKNPLWHRRYTRLWRPEVTILTPSEFMRQKVIALGASPARVVVQANGIDLQAWYYSDAASRFDGKVSFLFVGRLIEKKGPRQLVEAFAKMRALAPEIDAELVLCGAGSLEGALREDIARLGVGDAVRLRGAVPSDQVRQAMMRAHIMVQHSVETASGDMEGLPVSLTEAAACGLPIVATRHSGIPEIVVDGVNGYLVAEHDIDGMAAKMAELARDPPRWSAFGRAGRALVEDRFAGDAAIARYERLVAEQVLKR
jgi:colanic acid/amylovoran biosynthesis glycosyltransferase